MGAGLGQAWGGVGGSWHRTQHRGPVSSGKRGVFGVTGSPGDFCDFFGMSALEEGAWESLPAGCA